MGTRLFIGNLSYNVNEQELREAFSSERELKYAAFASRWIARPAGRAVSRSSKR